MKVDPGTTWQGWLLLAVMLLLAGAFEYFFVTRMFRRRGVGLVASIGLTLVVVAFFALSYSRH